MANNVREAVQIVLDRIESHPEDFEYGGRLYWLRGILDGKDATWPLNKNERDALGHAWNEAQYKRFHNQVLKSLLEENPSEFQEIESAIKAMEVQGNSIKPKKLFLSKTELEIAKKLGLTHKEYVRMANADPESFAHK